ncbi:cell division protein SepF [Bhargavaea beijingensis]|uniref:Cell division protein SepF n=1 Tax=Bhargavaea beijingensis TaxID=426756 RepID=A0A1G7C986_9BACL|nr:cell division protein SepF [Bhargavaea beijingensis]MCW1926865.1 cell division protein SepF [Bhargavaea beijingensis]RSK36890.1 cell division protein SepF [Bhargavaea beijingensis]SDE34985.1 cell division inhibitor SepF [Bhargavaea beijingensis]
MSFKDKFKNFFYLEEEEEMQEKSQPAPAQPPRPEPPRQAEQDWRQKDRRKPAPTRPQEGPNVVSLQSIKKSSKMILSEPRVYAEAQDIAEHLKNKRTVVVNLQRIDHGSGTRIIDFLSGTVYALGGDITRIGHDIFLCVPENVELSGEISEYLYDEFE